MSLSSSASLEVQTLARAEKHWRISHPGDVVHIRYECTLFAVCFLLLVVFRCFACLPTCSLAFCDAVCAAAPAGTSRTFQVQKEKFNVRHQCRLLKSTDYPLACACRLSVLPCWPKFLFWRVGIRFPTESEETAMKEEELWAQERLALKTSLEEVRLEAGASAAPWGTVAVNCATFRSSVVSSKM